MDTEQIVILSEGEIEKMRKVGRLAANLLKHLEPMVQVGTTTQEINDEAEKWTRAHGAKSGPLGYKGFPRSICTSINEVVCHGIPDPKRSLKNGDIINIDITVIKDGWHGDTSKMFLVGEPSVRARQLCDIAHKAMVTGIEMVKPGLRLGDIGHAIQQYAESQGCSVVRDYCGHGIGRGFHEDPQVLHYGRPGVGELLVPGMVFTIEPMINLGRKETRLLGDGWTVHTRDRSLSAQWEHTLAVTEDGHDVLTQLPGDGL
jgi:methionyl aminopeptidase